MFPRKIPVRKLTNFSECGRYAELIEFITKRVFLAEKTKRGWVLTGDYYYA